MYAATAVAVLLLLPALTTAAHWPFVHDAPIIRYVDFLMGNGFAPYRDIVDMQMPGTYLADSLVVHTLGAGAGAWWAWDVLNAAVIAFSIAWIAGKGRRLRGVTAGILACLVHLSEGPPCLGQRDWTVAMLLTLSAGCLFHFVRGGRPRWVGCAFLFGSLAATIKPPALLLPAVLLTAITLHLKQSSVASRQSSIPATRLVFWAFAGTLPPLLCILLFLQRWGALRAFLAIARGLAPYYASLHRPSLLGLADHARLPVMLAVVALACYIHNRSWRNVEINLLMLSSVCGLFVYVLQGKGFFYHQYTAITFLLLWVVTEISPQMEQRPASTEGPTPLTGAGLIAFVSLIGLQCVTAEAAKKYPLNTLNSLESDLNHFGGAELSHHVQCLDMTLASCINVLYRMKLVQSTGTISDFYLFADTPTPVTTALQDAFLTQVIASPPKVFVLSNQMWPSDREGYSDLANFPRFQTFLLDRYTLAREYRQTRGDPAGYRLYLRK